MSKEEYIDIYLRGLGFKCNVKNGYYKKIEYYCSKNGYREFKKGLISVELSKTKASGSINFYCDGIILKWVKVYGGRFEFNNSLEADFDNHMYKILSLAAKVTRPIKK